MTDLRGKELKIEDLVLFGPHGKLRVGKVVGFTPKKVRVEDINPNAFDKKFLLINVTIIENPDREYEVLDKYLDVINIML